MGKHALKFGKKLDEDEHIKSKCDNFKAIMQKDGNFVLYKGDHSTWASNTCGKGEGPFRLEMQEDGNLVVYEGNGNPTWASNTCGKGEGKHKLIMQEDGNLVVYAKCGNGPENREAIWATGTNE